MAACASAVVSNRIIPEPLERPSGPILMSERITLPGIRELRGSYLRCGRDLLDLASWFGRRARGYSRGWGRYIVNEDLTACGVGVSMGRTMVTSISTTGIS